MVDQVYPQLVEAESLWGEIIPGNALQPTNKTMQAEWDTPLYERQYSQLLAEEVRPTELARLRAVASEHSSDWLNDIPVPGLGLKLNDASFRVVCGLRLGLSLCKTYTCRCGQSVDELG